MAGQSAKRGFALAGHDDWAFCDPRF